MKPPKNISIKRIYEPNMQAMVHALRLVLEYDHKEKKDSVRKTSAFYGGMEG